MKTEHIHEAYEENLSVRDLKERIKPSSYKPATLESTFDSFENSVLAQISSLIKSPTLNMDLIKKEKLLDELVLIYSEDEIFTHRKDMPEFWYFTEDKNKHRYFPDVYIPKVNTIYEVKSEYILNESKKNGIFELKRQSVIDANYNFELKVY